MSVAQTFSIHLEQMQDFGLDLSKASGEVLYYFKNVFANSGGNLIVGRARELSSWSKKISNTLRWRTDSSGDGAKLTLIITAGYASVPIARWYELGHTNKTDHWRHPVWPRHTPRKKWHWVDQAKGNYHRPYLYPALMEEKDDVIKLTLQAIIAGTIAAVPYFKAIPVGGEP